MSQTVKRAFVIAAFGDRQEQITRLLKNIRTYSPLPIYILTTKDSNIGEIQYMPAALKAKDINIEFVERKWAKGTLREGVRNSNYWKIKFAITNIEFESLCLLDDDMYIVNQNYFDGFRIAERFGAALPANPRTYVLYNAMGADVAFKDIDDICSLPVYAPAVNFSPFFVSTKHKEATNFLRVLHNELLYRTCRGTLAIWKAMYETGYSPVILPEQWCVCASNAEYLRDRTEYLKSKEESIPVMMLHLGHWEVKKAFNL